MPETETKKEEKKAPKISAEDKKLLEEIGGDINAYKEFQKALKEVETV